MADQTPIEWTDATWNIITGCSVVSPGCTNCYAMKLAGTRLQHHPSRAGLTTASKAGPVWNGQVRFNTEWLTQPLRWTKPRMIFVCAHGDLFHEGVPDEWLDQIFAVMALAHQHTFQVLTKRPERMRAYFAETWQVPAQPAMHVAGIDIPAREAHVEDRWAQINLAIDGIICGDKLFDQDRFWTADGSLIGRPAWPRRPLPNVWLGVSVEDQTRADERIPILLDTPAAVRWISAEPLLGPLDLTRISPGVDQLDGGHPGGDDEFDACVTWWNAIYGGLYGADRWPTGEIDRSTIALAAEMPRLDWVVAGGESGPGARPMHPDWARQLRDQCAEAGVPFLFKQWGDWMPADRWWPANPRPQRAITREGWEVADDVAPEETPGGQRLMNVGKKAAGRHLDGQLHDGFPEVRP